MTSRERVLKTLNHEEVDRFPKELWALAGVWMHRSEEFKEVNKLIEFDTAYAPIVYGASPYATPFTGEVGKYTDDFGSEWTVGEPGVAGEVTRPVIDDWSRLDSYKMPNEMLDNIDTSKVSEFYANTDKFVLGGSHVRPFERLQFMRGTENLFMDMAYGEASFLKLKDMLFEFECRNLEILTGLDVDQIRFMDDWGTQRALLIDPEMWREYFKPMYKKYVEIIHKGGKKAFFHSDGFIEAIYPDLIEIGVDSLNSQLFCMDAEKIIDTYGDKITFWGEIDRQFVLPFGTISDVDAAVDRIAGAVMKKHGKRTGAVAQCEWGVHDPKENVIEVFKRWDEK